MTSGSSWTRGAESAIPGQRRAEDDRTGTRGGGDNRGAWPAGDDPADAAGREQDNESDAATSLRSGGIPRWRDRGKSKQAEPEAGGAQHLGDEDYFSYLRGDDPPPGDAAPARGGSSADRGGSAGDDVGPRRFSPVAPEREAPEKATGRAGRTDLAAGHDAAPVIDPTRFGSPGPFDRSPPAGGYPAPPGGGYPAPPGGGYPDPPAGGFSTAGAGGYGAVSDRNFGTASGGFGASAAGADEAAPDEPAQRGRKRGLFRRKGRSPADDAASAADSGQSFPGQPGDSTPEPDFSAGSWSGAADPGRWTGAADAGAGDSGQGGSSWTAGSAAPDTGRNGSWPGSAGPYDPDRSSWSGPPAPNGPGGSSRPASEQGWGSSTETAGGWLGQAAGDAAWPGQPGGDSGWSEQSGGVDRNIESWARSTGPPPRDDTDRAAKPAEERPEGRMRRRLRDLKDAPWRRNSQPPPPASSDDYWPGGQDPGRPGGSTPAASGYPGTPDVPDRPGADVPGQPAYPTDRPYQTEAPPSWSTPADIEARRARRPDSVAGRTHPTDASADRPYPAEGRTDRGYPADAPTERPYPAEAPVSRLFDAEPPPTRTPSDTWSGFVTGEMRQARAAGGGAAAAGTRGLPGGSAPNGAAGLPPSEPSDRRGQWAALRQSMANDSSGFLPTLPAQPPPSWEKLIRSSRREKVRPGIVRPVAVMSVTALLWVAVVGYGVWKLNVWWSLAALLAGAAGLALALRGRSMVGLLPVLAGAAAWGMATGGKVPASFADIGGDLRVVGWNVIFAVPLLAAYGCATWVDSARYARDRIRRALGERRWCGGADVPDAEPSITALETIPSARFFALPDGSCAHLVVAGRRMGLVRATVWPRGEYTGNDLGEVQRNGRIFTHGSDDFNGVMADVRKWTERMEGIAPGPVGFLVVHPASDREGEAVTIDIPLTRGVQVLTAAQFISIAGEYLAADPYRLDVPVNERLAEHLPIFETQGQ